MSSTITLKTQADALIEELTRQLEEENQMITTEIEGLPEVYDPDMEEDKEEKFLTVKQISTILQVEASTVRFWEKEFAEYMGQGVIRGQRKEFNQKQLEILIKIKELLQTEQYTIKGAKRRLELDNILSNSLGVEHNFKTTVIHMFSAIMEELQAARKQSRQLTEQVSKLRQEKFNMETQLLEEKNKGLIEFLKAKMQNKPREN
jgi:DNA-binding transcriptional MerR regulator